MKDHDNRDLTEVLRMREAEIEALRRRIEVLESKLNHFGLPLEMDQLEDMFLEVERMLLGISGGLPS